MTTLPTPDDTARRTEIERRLKAATDGPWEVSDRDVRSSAFVRAPRFGHVCNAPVPHADWHEAAANCNSQARKNIEFIAHAPSDIAYLLDELRKQLPPPKDDEDRASALANRWEAIANDAASHIDAPTHLQLSNDGFASGLRLAASELRALPTNDGTWNEAIEAAAKMANARFLVDPLTSPAIHILGLKHPTQEQEAGT